MNIEIANRLVELRKKNNLSQEELASKLGLSRQAVSKWERAEASPDTDNLICLAKIYNVSLDELLKNDAPVQDIIEAERPAEEKAEEKPGEPKRKKNYVHIGGDGIHVIDDDEEVHISGRGLSVVDGDTHVQIGPGGIHLGDAKIEKKIRKTRELVAGLTALVCVITYILVGALYQLWHPLWIIFLAIPIAESIVSAIAYRRITKLSYPVIVTAAFLLVGFLTTVWHPTWVMFVTIPIFYMAFRPLEKLWLKDKTITIDGVEIKLDKVGEEDKDKDEDDEDDKD
jgi:HTH-type transcriptional regulator/antitoxin HipB